MLEHLEAQWLSGGEFDVAAWTAITNVLRRVLQTIGMERRAADVTSLSDYLAGKAATPPSVVPSKPPRPKPIPPSPEVRRTGMARRKAAAAAVPAPLAPPPPPVIRNP
jgi:hypothetical protein